MLLLELAETSRSVGATARRLQKISELALFLRRLTPDETEIGVAFLSGEIRQAKIGVGPALLRDTWHTPVATAPTLTLEDVDQALQDMAQTGGAGAAAQRKQSLEQLLTRATALEQDFLRRLLSDELRQGALEALLQEALAQAAAVPLREVRRAVMLAGRLPAVARAALTDGAAGLSRYRLQMFRPLQPMLAQPAEDVSDALRQLGSAALEWKLDGARVQVHKSGDQVRVYTRSLNDVTAVVPEVVEAMCAVPAPSLILDGEVIALHSDGRPQPFQITMRRFGRKLDVAALRATVPLSAFFFDCLHLDGEDLIDLPAAARFERLAQTLPADQLTPRLITADLAAGQAFFAEALARGHEGVMAKSLLAPYEAGSRGSSWLKIKQAHTLDLVVLAVEWGNGRRRGWLSNIHLGARDPERSAFVMLGKTFKGMTDEMLQWQTQRFLDLEVSRDAYTVYLRPEQVVEIAVNEIQASPRYPGGMALRFARVKRYRDDKSADEADTVETVRRLFLGQEPGE